MPSNPGPAGWNEILGPAPVRASLQEHRTADWIVIGAGFSGLSAASRLKELCPGQSIAVLEASRVASGPAGRNSGFMIDVPHDLSSSDYGGDTARDQREIRLNRAGIDYAIDLCSRFGAGDETLSKSGKVNGAITKRGVMHNNNYAKHLDRLKLPYERLDARDMHELTGTQAYIDGLYTPGTALIQPALYIRSLADYIESDNVVIYENSPVIELKRLGSAWEVRGKNGSVTAPRVILGVNGHLQSFGYSKRELMHVFTYSSMTRKMSADEISTLGGQPKWGITSADPMGTTVRRISSAEGHRIIVRNRVSFNSSMQVKDERLKVVGRTHDQSFSDRFPMLPELEMEYRWGGLLCLTRNSVSVFGEIENGLYSACCQNGLGTVKGTISGKLAAELACGVSSDILNDKIRTVKPTKLPPEPIATLGVNAILRWREFRAGMEL